MQREVRDEKVAFFASECGPGEHSWTYELRVTQPGTFRVLPTLAYGMYNPEVRGHTASDQLRIAGTSVLGPQVARRPGPLRLAWASLLE